MTVRRYPARYKITGDMILPHLRLFFRAFVVSMRRLMIQFSPRTGLTNRAARAQGGSFRLSEEQTNGGKKNFRQVVKFTLFSASAGIIQFGTFALFKEAFHWAPWLAYLVSLILSVIWNFTFNRRYTFRSGADIKRSMLLVGLFYLVFTPLSTWWTAALTGANPFTGAEASSEPLVNSYVVQIGTMLINFVTEFLYQKFVVYRGTEDTIKQKPEQG